MASKVVCVTGASGFIASWLVKLLLERGYFVRATVRDLNDPSKTKHLRSLEGADERLQFFTANLREDGSFDAAIDGCEGVFHTASPFYHDVKDPEFELLEPAVKGALNVLSSCAKASTVKRVIVTSSVAAVIFNTRPRSPEVTVDESWYSDPIFLKENKSWYALSKTLAEEAAWKFAKEKGIDMVTINPAMVLGPLLQPTLNTSCAAIQNLLSGSSTYLNLSPGWISVKDVANAHILAYEVPSASGRYIMAERVAHYSEIVNILRKLYPNSPLPTKCADDKPFLPTYKVSRERVEELGVKYTPLEDVIKETVASLVEKGMLKLESS